MVLLLGLRVTPLSKYVWVVVVFVYPVGANNNGYVLLSEVGVWVTLVSVLLSIDLIVIIPSALAVTVVLPAPIILWELVIVESSKWFK